MSRTSPASPRSAAAAGNSSQRSSSRADPRSPGPQQNKARAQGSVSNIVAEISDGSRKKGPNSKSQDQVTSRSSPAPKTNQTVKSSPQPKSNTNGSSVIARSPKPSSGTQRGQLVDHETASQTLRNQLTNFTLRHFLPAVSFSSITKAFGSTKWEALEPFLKNLRIETRYLKEKDSGKEKVKAMTIRKFGRMRLPILDDQGEQKTDEGGKRQWEGPEDYAPGSAETLKFALKSQGMISMEDDFKER